MPGCNSTAILRLSTAVVLALFALSGCLQAESEQAQKSETVEQTTGHNHAIAGETCFICDESKRDPDRLWCAGHDCYEDRCWLCQPQLEDKTRLYCSEHSLYEDECFLCHPELAQTASNHDSDRTGELFCNEHNVYEMECGICQPQRTAELRPGEELKVRFESSLSTEKAGLQTQRPEVGETQPSLSAICEVQYNKNELAQITPFASGIVKRVLVDVGAEVEAGQALVEIHSVELASARADFISATVDLELMDLTYAREKDLNAKNISSEQDLQEAAAQLRHATLAVDTAKHRLLNLGLSTDEVAQITQTNDNSASLLIRAPFSGTLVARDVVRGEAVKPGDALFTLADLSTMWLSLSMAADDAHALTHGLIVEASLGSLSSAPLRGEITWVNTAIDEKTRRVQAQAVVPNDSRQLKAGMYGNAQVLMSADAQALTVPVSAVQYFQDRHFVFVKHAADLYGLRRVTLGATTDKIASVTAGLEPSERVVVAGAFTAMSEFLKSRLGAGCVDH